MKRFIIETDKAPPAIGPYSQGRVICRSYGEGDKKRYEFELWTAGQLPIDPKTGKLVGVKWNQDTNEVVSVDIEEQTNQVLDNLHAILDEVGFSFGNVEDVLIAYTRKDHYKGINSSYEKRFPDHAPPRFAFGADFLPMEGAYVEIKILKALGEEISEEAREKYNI